MSNHCYKNYYIGACIGILFGMVLFCYWKGYFDHFSLASMKQHATSLKMNVASHYVQSVLLFLSVSITLIALTIPLTGPIGIIAGFLFGGIAGIGYCMLAIAVGSALSFVAIRYAFSSMLKNQYETQLAAFNQKMRVHGALYLVSLQLLSVIPYFIMNVLAVLSGVSFITFLWTTVLGSLPVMLMYVCAGRQLYKMQSLGDVVTKEMLLLLIFLVILVLLPMIIGKIRARREKSSTYSGEKKR